MATERMGLIPGQEKALEMITQARKRGRLGHALLLSGPPGIGKKALALEIARQRNCLKSEEYGCGQCSACRKVNQISHPDVIVVTPLEKKDQPPSTVIEKLRDDHYAQIDGGSLSRIFIGQIRELIHWSNMTSFEGRKTAIICHADHMREDAANALLKTLEEPTEDTQLILTADRPNSLLPTIRSRMQTIRCVQLTHEAVAHLLQTKGVSASDARDLAPLASGNFNRAAAVVGDPDENEPRSKSYHLLVLGIEGPPHKLLAESADVARRLDREGLDSILSWMLLWLRDVWVIQSGIGDDIINADRRAQTEKLAGLISWHLAGDFVEKVEKLQEMLSRNVNAPLAFGDFLMSIFVGVSRAKSATAKAT